MSGTALVVSGPSGVGKGTVIAELLHRRPDLWLSVSATTRAPVQAGWRTIIGTRTEGSSQKHLA